MLFIKKLKLYLTILLLILVGVLFYLMGYAGIKDSIKQFQKAEYKQSWIEHTAVINQVELNKSISHKRTYWCTKLFVEYDYGEYRVKKSKKLLSSCSSNKRIAEAKLKNLNYKQDGLLTIYIDPSFPTIFDLTRESDDPSIFYLVMSSFFLIASFVMFKLSIGFHSEIPKAASEN